MSSSIILHLVIFLSRKFKFGMGMYGYIHTCERPRMCVHRHVKAHDWHLMFSHDHCLPLFYFVLQIHTFILFIHLFRVF